MFLGGGKRGWAVSNKGGSFPAIKSFHKFSQRVEKKAHQLNIPIAQSSMKNAMFLGAVRTCHFTRRGNVSRFFLRDLFFCQTRYSNLDQHRCPFFRRFFSVRGNDTIRAMGCFSFFDDWGVFSQFLLFMYLLREHYHMQLPCETDPISLDKAEEFLRRDRFLASSSRINYGRARSS